MCGIAGVFLFEGLPDRPRLELAAKRLQHRGPDGCGYFLEDHIGLVHTRLSIIDLEGGAQPLSSPDGNMRLVANGEIYNYPELRKSFDPQTGVPLTGSDCECIIQAWSLGGLDRLKELHGMFAFALYDREQKKLVLGRDRLGIKPLYYLQMARGLVFASELKALVALLDKTPEIEASAFSQFLNYQFNTGRDTILQGVKRLLPGEVLQISSDGSLLLDTYWRLSETKTIAANEQEASTEFNLLFDQVMKEHMRSDVPLGLFLSGGIDSSVLLAELAKLRGKTLRTYSIGFSESKLADELDAASSLAKQFGTEHCAVRVSREELFGGIVRACWASDDLMRDYASLPTLLLSQIAARDIKVVFSGEGGDEAFAGYRRYRPGIEACVKSAIYGSGGNRVRGQWHTGSARASLGAKLAATDPRMPFRQLWNQAPDDWSWMRKSQYVDICSALPDNLLSKADRMMMSAGLEGRVPFADHRMMELGISLNDAIKYRAKRGKQVIRNWASGHLPAEHLAKPKRGFYVPVSEWLSGQFLTDLEEALCRSPIVNEWFHTKVLRQLFAMQRQGKNCAREIWGVMQFSIWHGALYETPDAVPGFAENPLDWIR